MPKVTVDGVSPDKWNSDLAAGTFSSAIHWGSGGPSAFTQYDNWLDYTLAKGSPAIDAGVVLPTINDNFTGHAPDLGAVELNQPEPHYGPRWITWKRAT